MSFFRFIKLLINHYKLVILVPCLLAGLVVYLTRDEAKFYSSTTSLYTGIASGFNVDMKQGVGNRFTIESVFENILTIMKSKGVKKEVALKLMAQHLSQNPNNLNPRVCDSLTIAFLYELVPVDVRKVLSVVGNAEQTYNNIAAYVDKDSENVIYQIIHSKQYIAYYSLLALNDLYFKRLKTSDLIKIDYTSADPGVALNTLIFFSETFIEHYRYLKVSETSDIVSYFEGQLEKAQAKLDALEAQLLSYRSSNNILDYTEQVRAIAQRRQEMEGEIYKERMRLSSAEYTSEYTQQQLDMHKNILEKNTTVLAKRKQLEELSSAVAMAKVFDSGIPKDSLNRLTKQLNALRREMEGDLDAIFAINYSTSGVKTKDFLKQWFDNIINAGESKARLKIFEVRQEKFQELYRTMAPIGSNLTKIEREVAVAESAYLRILEALNLAKMRQRNITLSTKLKIVDDPSFPTHPDPSQRKMLVVIAFLVGGLLIVGLLVLLEFANQSIRQPMNLIKATGLHLAGAYPIFPKKKRKVHYNQLEFALTQRLIEQLQQRLKESGIDQKQPKYITICSMQDTEGKTLVSRQLASKLANMGKRVCLYQSSVEKDWEAPFIRTEEREKLSDAVEVHYYDLDTAFLQTSSIQAMTAEATASDYIIIELPYLQSYQTPHTILSTIDYCLLVTRANRSWTKADRVSLDNLKAIVKQDPLVFLNGVKLHFLEEIIGVIPKERSPLRRRLRQLAHLEFKK